MRPLGAGILVLGMGWLASNASAQTAPAPATTRVAEKPKVSVISLLVVRGADPVAMRALIDSPGGAEYKTGVSLVGRVTLPAINVVSVDKAVRVQKFGDDKGTDFGNGEVKTRFGNEDQAQCYMSPDRKQCTFWLGSPKLPEPGADKVLVEGALNLRVGTGEKSAESRKLPLKLGQEYACGSLNLKLVEISAEGGQGSLLLTFTSPQPLDHLKSVECTDEDGKTVAVQMQDRYGRNDPRVLGLELARPVKEMTLRVVEHEKIETLTVPVKLEVKVGL